MMARRLLSLLLSLMLMAGFYVLAVMMEGEPGTAGTSPAPSSPIQAVQTLESQDPKALARAFGSSLPLPEGFLRGKVEPGSFQGQTSLLIALEGEKASLRGIRPAHAASSIMPRDALFLPSGKALLGHELLVAGEGEQQVFALITEEAAFLITPKNPGNAGQFILEDITP